MKMDETLKSKYAELINKWLHDSGSHLGHEIANISTFTQGDIDRLESGIADNNPLVPVLILDRINK